MGYFSYCFCITLFHSLWQSALLAGIYLLLNKWIPGNLPVIKRNIVYLLLTGQLFVSILTFILTWNKNGITEIVLPEEIFSTENNNWLQQAGPWIIAAYFLIIMVKSTKLILNWYRFKSAYKASLSKPSIDTRLFTTLKAMEFGIRRKVSIWLSDAVSSPVTFGFFKPVILFPVALINNLSVEETETLIIHELTHIRNNDYLLNWLLVTMETVFFFNPFILLMGRHIKMEREKQCDVNVLQFRYPAITYAESLLKAAYFNKTNSQFCLTAASSKNELLKRIEFFTINKNLHFHKRNYSFLAIAPLLLVLALSVLMPGFTRKEKTVEYRITENVLPAIQVAQSLLPTVESLKIPVEKAVAIAEKSAAIVALKSSELAFQQATLQLKERELQKLQAEMDEYQAQSAGEMPVNIAVPATLTTPENSRQVTVTEENSETGTSVTKVYKLDLVNGVWKSKLLWSVVEKAQTPDSNLVIKDSTGNYKVQ